MTRPEDDSAAKSQSVLNAMVRVVPIVWLNLWFWTVAPNVSILFAAVAVPYTFLFKWIGRDPRKTRWLVRRSLRRYALLILKCGWPLVRVRWVNPSTLDRGPFVFVANHRSFSDGFLVSLLPIEGVQALNIWPSRVWVMGRLARAAGYLPIREMPFEQFLAAGAKLLADGCSIVVFPEGTRSGARQMGQFHGGAFRLAMACGASVIPLAITGNQDIPPRGSMLLRPGVITVTRLPVITREQYAGFSPFKLKQTVRDKIQSHLDTLR